MPTLYIKPSSNEFFQIYEDAATRYNNTPLEQRNSGFDLFCDATDVDTEYSRFAALVGQGCRILALDDDDEPMAWWLAPRSSISRTSLRLANSLGLMDATYRGVVRAALTDLINHVPNASEFVDFPRMVQAATPMLTPWTQVLIVRNLPGEDTQRGEGGFGSTGR
jgi:dUTP pyrophosphatase